MIDRIFDEFERQRPSLEMSADRMREHLAAFRGNIFLYGAGSSGIAFFYDLKKLDITPLFFVDSNEHKIGQICEGLEVISPDRITDRVQGDPLVIVCINTDGKRYCKSFDEALRVGGHHGVYDRLRAAGCKNVIDYTFFRRCFSIFGDERYNAPSCSDVDLMVRDRESIAWVHDQLEDAVSKETFEKIVRFRLLDDSIEVPTCSQQDQYFEQGLYHPREDAVFVDCGAYNGISAETFLKRQRHGFERYYGFEPDPANYAKLVAYRMQQEPTLQDRMILSDKALWDKADRIGLYALDGPGSFVADDIGRVQVETTTLDSALNGGKATFIKMNIEGSEKQALAGAEQTIRRYRPELAIAGYHRTDDLWKIPMQIKAYYSGYRLNLRSYMNHISFVYYAA